MGISRGAANLRQYNEARSKGTIPMIEQELKLCARRKLRFRTPGALAAHIADRTGVHRTTLLRNSKYKAMLFGFIASQPGAASIATDGCSDAGLLRSRLVLMQVEVSNLKEEVKTLRARIAGSGAPGTALGGCGDVAYADLAMLLCLILERVDTIVVDFSDRSVIDLAAKPSQRIVATGQRTSTFIDWLNRNAALPLVHRLRTLASG